MKNSLKTAMLATALIFCATEPAFAGPPHHGYSHHAPRHHGHYRHNNHRWEGVAAALIVTGLIGAAIASHSEPPPPAVVAVPHDPNTPNIWYFCDSARLYYPQVRYCPEGWRIIRQ